MDELTARELLEVFVDLSVMSEEQNREYFEERETRTAACMSAAGFDYVPVPYLGGTSEDPTWNAEYTAEYGYGISISAPEPETRVNPNDEYYSALSPEGQVRYDEAMYGPPSVVDDEDGCKFAGAAELLPPSAPAPSLVTAIYDEINYRV